MKKLFYLLLALPLAFAACNETPETPVQKEYAFEVTSEKVMEFGVEGGKGLIEWTINEVTRFSPVPEPVPTFVTEAEWIALDAENLGAFTVAANEGEPREAVIRIEFLEQVEEVAVKQEGFIIDVRYSDQFCSLLHPQPQPSPLPFCSVTLGGKNSSVGKSSRENISHGLSVLLSQRLSGMQKS